MIPTDEIISMANQCGLPLTYVPHDDDTFSLHVDGLAAFANLVAARAAVIEREKVDAQLEARMNQLERKTTTPWPTLPPSRSPTFPKPPFDVTCGAAHPRVETQGKDDFRDRPMEDQRDYFGTRSKT